MDHQSDLPISVYPKIKSLITSCHAESSEMIDFFKERARVEDEYAKGLERLSNRLESKHHSSRSEEEPAPSILHIAFTELQKKTNVVAKRHKEFADEIQRDVVKELESDRDNMVKESLNIRGEMKQANKDFIELKVHTVPKLKKAYHQKCKDVEEMEAYAAVKDDHGSTKKTLRDLIPRDPVKASAKLYKMRREIDELDGEYRKAIRELEDKRVRQDGIQRSAYKKFENLEVNRCALTHDKLAGYVQAEGNLAEDIKKLYADYGGAVVDCIKPTVHREQLWNMAERIEWLPNKPFPPTLYENYYAGPSKDMAFGVPLQKHLAFHNRKVPLIIQRCVEVLEANGLDREGIYRVSALKSDIIRLKQAFEVNGYAQLLSTEFDGNGAGTSGIDRGIAESAETSDGPAKPEMPGGSNSVIPQPDFSTVDATITSAEKEPVTLPSLPAVLPQQQQWSDIPLLETAPRRVSAPTDDLKSSVGSLNSQPPLPLSLDLPLPEGPPSALSPAINSGVDDIMAVAGLLKLYLRELPDALFPFDLPGRIACSKIESVDGRLDVLSSRLKNLPDENYNTLRYLVQHLARVTMLSSQNKMTPSNLAIIFNPCIFEGSENFQAGPSNAQPPTSAYAAAFQSGATDRQKDTVIEDMINHVEVLLPERAENVAKSIDAVLSRRESSQTHSFGSGSSWVLSASASTNGSLTGITVSQDSLLTNTIDSSTTTI